MVSRRESATAYLAHGNRLRIRRGQHRLRKDRSKMLDLQKGGGACRNTCASISTAPGARDRLKSKEKIYAVDGTKYCSRVPGGRARASHSEAATAPSGNPEIREIFYAVDAEESEVSQVPAGQPQGNGFAQSANRLRRVRIANPGARLDHQHPDRGRACSAYPQHEAQRQAVDSDFSRQIGHGASAGNANGQRQRSAGVLGGNGAARQHFV